MNFSALVGAIFALLMQVILYASGQPVHPAVLGPSAVVILTFAVAWFFPAAKEAAGTVASALVVIVQAILSARAGGVLDTALVSTALTAIVQVVLLYVLPRVQLGREPPASANNPVNLRPHI